MGGLRFGTDSDGKPGVIITDEAGADSVLPFKPPEIVFPFLQASRINGNGNWSGVYGTADISINVNQQYKQLSIESYICPFYGSIRVYKDSACILELAPVSGTKIISKALDISDAKSVRFSLNNGYGEGYSGVVTAKINNVVFK